MCNYAASPVDVVGDAEVQYAFNVCRTSPFVQKNSVYRRAADLTEIRLDSSSSINGYAGADDAEHFHIVIFQGIVDWSVIFGIIWMLVDEGLPVGKAVKLVDWCRAHSSGKASTATIRSFIHENHLTFNTYQVEQIRSNVLLMIETTVAHELGHICLAHVLDSGYDSTVMSSNRNIERQADLFSASVIQTSSNVSGGAIAAVMSEISLLVLGDYDGSQTHPSSGERIENLFISYKGLFTSKTMSEAVLRKLAGMKK